MKITKFLFALVSTAFILSSCANDSSDSSGGSYKTDSTLYPIQDGYIRINTLASNASNIWIWDDFDASEKAMCTEWKAEGGAFPVTGSNGDFKYFDIKLSSNPSLISFIIRSNYGDNKVSGSGDIHFKFPNKYKELFLKANNGTVYIDSNCSKEAAGIASVTIVGQNKMEVECQNITLNQSNTKVYKADGKTELTTTSVSGTTIIVSENLKSLGSVLVKYTDNLGTDTRSAIPSNQLLDSWYKISDLSTLGYKDGVFTTWAPLASNAKVILFANMEDAIDGSTEKIAATCDMTRNANGTWSTENVSATVGSNKYYKYRLTNNDTVYDVCDLWSKVDAKDSVATQITSIPTNSYEASYFNPWTGTDNTKAIIYEMHITDWSQAYRTSIGYNEPGTFKEISDALGTDGTGPLAQHLKDLGITHVQILPMFEYAKVGTDDKGYNWGYNPYNYNTPESRYVKNMNDGTDAVDQLREMVSSFHKAGISVVMDVVYNHTAGTGAGSIYDMTVPTYFYTGEDNTGCGNTLASGKEMVKAFMIDSLKNWMNTYHINGFRFDLMGCEVTDTMKEIYTELTKIDSKVIVYGEPWAGSGSVYNGTVSSIKVSNTNGVGTFDDDFRDAIKGAEFGGFQRGQIQIGNSDLGITTGLVAGENKRNDTGIPGLSLHYVECHDNYTLFDKLVYSTDSTVSGDGDFAPKFKAAYDAVMADASKLESIKAQDKLAAAYIFLAQGTPFINGGQEFLRTKKGDPDSYAADKKGGITWTNTAGEYNIDDVNTIDLSMKTAYSDVYNTYKGLIALRKANSAAFGANENAKASTVSTGVTKYTTDDFCVYFNASDAAVNISTSGYTKLVDVTSGNPTESTTESTTVPTTVPAKSFVILKK